MSTARESLLTAAHAAVRKQPWTVVRMVDVAASAGVSRQTLYNEFGSKEGLGAALVNGLVERFLEGAAQAVAEARRRGADAAGCCSAAADWMLRTAHEEPIVRAALTGGWSSRMPLPAPGRQLRPGGWPADPGGLAEALCERTGSGIHPPVGDRRGDGQRAARAYELGLRVALSYVVAPDAGSGGSTAEPSCRVGEVVRALLTEDSKRGEATENPERGEGEEQGEQGERRAVP